MANANVSKINMDHGSLPLLELFTRLRDAGLPLGIDEYQLVLKALQGGFGIRDRPSLQRLCEALWTKNNEEKKLLDYHFQQLVKLEDPSIYILQKSSKPIKNFRAHPILFILISVFLLLGLYIMTARISPEGSKSSDPTYPIPSVEPLVPGQPEQQKLPSPSPPRESPPTAPESLKNVWLIWLIIGLIALPCGVLIVGWLSRLLFKKPQSSRTKYPPSQITKTTQAIDDEIEAAQIYQRSLKNYQIRLLMTMREHYLPITQRQMKRSWRYLSRPVREGTPTELDVEATIQRISQQGLFLEPVLVPPRINRAALLLLIDQEGSMVAFHKLTERLIQTAHRGGRFDTTHVYYFHNCPVGFLYHDAFCLSEEPMEELFKHLPLQHLSALVVSDGGAVRNGYNPYRVTKTKDFLIFLRQRIRNIAWLNPVSKERWADTTAEAIAREVPMFSCERSGLDGAIEVLRGRKYASE